MSIVIVIPIVAAILRYLPLYSDIIRSPKKAFVADFWSHYGDRSTDEKKDLPIDMQGRIQEEFVQPVLMHVTSHCTIEIILTIVP